MVMVVVVVVVVVMVMVVPVVLVMGVLVSVFVPALIVRGLPVVHPWPPFRCRCRRGPGRVPQPPTKAQWSK